MATIDFRGYRIQSDAEGWSVGKPKTRLNKKKELEIYLEKPAYYSSLEAALAGLLRRELRESDAKSISEVLGLIREIQAEFKEAIAV